MHKNMNNDQKRKSLTVLTAGLCLLALPACTTPRPDVPADSELETGPQGTSGALNPTTEHPELHPEDQATSQQSDETSSSTGSGPSPDGLETTSSVNTATTGTTGATSNHPSTSTGSTSGSTSGTNDSSSDTQHPPPDCSLGLDAVEDPALQKLILEELSFKKNGDLRTVRSIMKRTNEDGSKIKSIRGLRCLSRLATFDVHGQEISSLAEFTHLRHLRTLNLIENPVSVNNLKELENSELLAGGLHTIGLSVPLGTDHHSWLNKTNNVERLHLSGPGVNNELIERLATDKPTRAQGGIFLYSPGVTDLSSLKARAQATHTLSLKNVNKQVVYSIPDLTGLRRLDIRQSDIENLSWLPSSQHMLYISITDSNKLSNIDGVEKLYFTYSLNLSDNNIVDVSKLVELVEKPNALQTVVLLGNPDSMCEHYSFKRLLELSKSTSISQNSEIVRQGFRLIHDCDE